MGFIAAAVVAAAAPAGAQELYFEEDPTLSEVADGEGGDAGYAVLALEDTGSVFVDEWAVQDALTWYGEEGFDAGLAEAAEYGAYLQEGSTVLEGVPSVVAPYEPAPAGTDAQIPECKMVCMPTSNCATSCMATFATSTTTATLPGYETAQPVAPSGSGSTLTTCGQWGTCQKPDPPPSSGTSGTSSSGSTSGGSTGGMQTSPPPQCGGKPAKQWKHELSMSNYTGNSIFGAGYDIGARIEGKDKSVAGTKGDKLEGKAWLGADVKVFGYKVRAVDASAKAWATSGVDAGFGVTLKTVGITLLNKTYKGQLKKTWTYKQTFFKASTTFVVWIIPVTVGVSVGGEIGIGIKGGPTAAPGLEFGAEPLAKLYGTANGGIGVSGFSAGVALALTFIEATLPVMAKLELPNKCLTASFTIDFVLGTLGGQMQLYIEFIKRWTLPVFKWKGFSYSWNLLTLKAQFPLM